MMKFIIVSFCFVLLVGCAGKYTFNSNLNKNEINEYFKVSTVQLIEKSHIPPRPFNPLGIVDGESCQIGLNDAPASAAMARTQLRKHAANKGANGVMLDNCINFDEPDSGCITRVYCVGQAISMESAQSYK